MKIKITGEEFGSLLAKGIRNFMDYDLSLVKSEEFAQQVKGKKLFEVDLSGHDLSNLNADVFKNVKFINLSNCNLENFDPQQVYEKCVVGVNLSNNDFSYLRANAFNDVNVEGANLSNCNLKNFTPQRVRAKSLYGTNLSGNDLSYLDENAFDNVIVKFANLSNCNLKNFNPQQVEGKNLCQTILSRNDFSYLEANAFEHVNVEGASLDNCNLKNFRPQYIDGKSLCETDLSGNDLGYLDKYAFESVYVEKANLSNCNLKNFRPRSVAKKSLSKTNLSGNDLSYLGKYAFYNVRIALANLSNCNLKKFNPKSVAEKSLFETNLSGNDLSYLGKHAFDNVVVELANLSNCNLKKFNPQRIADKSLCRTDLSGNDLSYLGEYAFDNVKVEGTNLSNCNLKNFSPQRIADKSLCRTDLSGNDLSYLQADAFEDVDINEANFENTGVHIDLTKVREHSHVGNMKGCSVINFEEAIWARLEYYNEITYYEDSFDEEFIARHKEYFIDKTAPLELKERFYSRTLDLKIFSKYYELLKDKNYKLYFRNLAYVKLGELFDIEDMLKIVKNDPEKIQYLLCENRAEEVYRWYKEHKFIPNMIILEYFPKDQIHKFNCKRWSNLMKNEEFNKNYNASLGLLKAAMVMGVFEKEEHGYIRLLQMINQEYKVLGSSENEKYKVLNPSNVHRIFDSMSMTYDKDFKQLFMDNLEKILKDSEFSEKVSSIQKNFADIKAEYKGKKITLDMCENYLGNLSYENVKEGGHELAIYAKNNGYKQNGFEKLQEAFLEGKQRESSSIPKVQVKTNKLSGRVLRLDDPLALVIGNLTECCQRLDGAAESSMLHSMLEKNGRVFVVEDQIGRVVAQSWVWRSGNALCFDNIEVPDRALEYKGEILEVYKEAANEFIREDRDVFEVLVNESKVSEKEAKRLKLAKITVGKGYTDVSLDKLKKDDEMVKPEESKKLYNDQNLYISDSEQQYILYKAPDYKKIEEKSKVESLDLYKDGRNLPKVINGKKMHKDIIKLIKKIESQAFSHKIQVLQEIQSYKDIAEAYDYNKDDMRVVYNNDWYMIYEEKDDEAHIGDIANIKTSPPQADEKVVKEQEKEFYSLLNKYKKVSMEARDKTSFDFLKGLEKDGKINILVEGALEDFRGNSERMYKLVVTKNDNSDRVVQFDR